MNVSVLEGIVNFLVESLFDFLTQHVDIGFVDIFTLFDQRDSVIDVNIGKLCLFLLPVFVQNEQKLFGSSCRKHRKETFSSSLDNFSDFLFKHLLPDGPVFVHSDTKRTFYNQNINIGLRNFGLHDIPIFLTGVVACIQNLHTIDFYDEHGGSYNMTRDISCYFNSFFLQLDAEIDCGNLFHRIANLLLREKSLLITNFKRITDQVMVDVFSWLCHVNFLLVVIVCQEIGQGSTMVKMCVGDQDQR